MRRIERLAGLLVFTGVWLPSCQEGGEDALTTAPTPPAISLSAEELDFGRRMIRLAGAKSLVVMNAGGELLAISAIRVDGLDQTAFAAPETTTALLPGDSIGVAVRFQAEELRAYEADLVVETNAPGGPTHVPLRGVGVAECCGSDDPACLHTPCPDAGALDGAPDAAALDAARTDGQPQADADGGTDAAVDAASSASFCADGTTERVYGPSMEGCDGHASSGADPSLCAPGFHVCSVEEFVARGGSGPANTNDRHRYLSSTYAEQLWCGSPNGSAYPVVLTRGGARTICTPLPTDYGNDTVVGREPQPYYYGEGCSSVGIGGWFANCSGLQDGVVCCP